MKNFVRRIRNIGNSGSTLIAVLVVTAILSLFLFTLQPIMGNYVTNSVKEMDLKQAEFSARSANDAIVKAILDDTVKGHAALVAGIDNLVSDGSLLMLDDFSFSSLQMGSVEAQIQLSDGQFSVVTKATVNEAERTIGREIIKESTSSVIDENALKSFYFNSSFRASDDNNSIFTGNRSLITVGNVPVVVAGSFILNNGILNIGGDLILYGNRSNTIIAGNSQLILKDDGTIFTGSGVFRIQETAKLHYKGETYERIDNSANRDLSSDEFIEQVTTADRPKYNADPIWYKLTGSHYTEGPLEGGTYNEVRTTATITDIDKRLDPNVTPSNPVYIIVKPNVDLRLTTALDHPDDGVPKDPRVVFILESGADLLLQKNSSAVVYGKDSNSRLYISNFGTGTSKFYGQIRVGSIRHISGNFVTNTQINHPIELNYRAASTPGSVTWTAGQYKQATYIEE